ncbi:MAG: MFS transporter [Halorhabdus sp.]
MGRLASRIEESWSATDWRRGRVLLAVAGGWLLLLGLRFVLPALLPQIKAEFGVDNASAGVAITVVWLTYGLMQFPAGVLTDRTGERRLLVWSLAITAGSTLLLSLAPVFAGFLVACAGFGLGAGLYGPARGVLLSRTFPRRDGLAIGFTIAAGSVGAASLPVIATTVSASYDWRTALGALAPLCLVVALLLRLWVPRTDDGDGTLSLPSVGRLVAELRRRAVVIGVAAESAATFVFQAVTAFLPTYLAVEKGIAPGVAAGLYAIVFVSSALCQPVAGNVADRIGYRPTLVGVAASSIVPLAALPFVEGVVPLGVAIFALGVQQGLIPVNNAYLVSQISTDVKGTAWGFSRMVFFALASTGSSVVGVMADAQLFDEAFWLLAAIASVTTAVYWWLPTAREATDEGAVAP